MIRPGKVIKTVVVLSLLSFIAAFGSGCACFVRDCTAEASKAVAAPVPVVQQAPLADYGKIENAAKKAESAASLAEAAAKKAEMAAAKAEMAAGKAEKAADKAEAAANKAEAIFMKKMKK
ncbi:MAG: hypothetical protein C0407_15270 [Desulfobacca sp.]|nr:hypothetical protein [Desulfobacca sp.]